MGCIEKVFFSVEISPELNEDLQRLITQSDLSAEDLLQGMVTLYKEAEILQKMEILIKQMEEQYPDNHFIPTTVLLQQKQVELIATVKKFLNTLTPGTFPPAKQPRVHGLLGY